MWAFLVAWRLPYDGGFWTSRDGWVTDLDPGGAAYAAGFRIGDRLVAIDGVPLDSLSGLYRGKQPGDTVRYSLERAGRLVEVSLVLTTPPFREWVMQFEQLLVGPVFWLVSLMAWVLRPFDGGTRRFYLISQIVAASIAVNSLASMRWPWMFLFTDVSDAG